MSRPRGASLRFTGAGAGKVEIGAKAEGGQVGVVFRVKGDVAGGAVTPRRAEAIAAELRRAAAVLTAAAQSARKQNKTGRRGLFSRLFSRT